MKSKLIIILAIHLFACPCSGDIFDTVNNFVSNGDAEQGWTDWYRSVNTSLASDSVNYGSNSFQLEPTTGIHSDIRTGYISAQPSDIFVLKYNFKSLAGTVIELGSSFIALRSFDENNNYLGEDQFELQITNGNWAEFEHEITTKTGCRKIDIWFIVNGFGSQASSGQFRIDNVQLYRFIPSMSRGIGAVSDQVFVIRQSALNNAEFVMMQTLQGLLAQTKPEIWIDQGDTSLLDDLVANHGITYTRSDSLFFYLNRYLNRVNGYVLYDLNDLHSITAANSMASILNAVMVDISLQSYMNSLGYSQTFDARGKTDQWVYDNYWDDFNHDSIIVREEDISAHPAAYYFRDWGVAIKSIFWWNSSTTLSQQIYDSVTGNAPCYGWTDGTAAGSEQDSIAFHSESGLYQVPADWLLNLSTLAGMAKRTQPWDFNQPISDNTYTKEQGVHYVAFKMSDMDNILTLIAANNFRTNSLYYANSNRGTIAMGWGMPPSLVELAPSAVELWYRDATENDGFSAPTSGMGYTYPHLWPENELQANMLKLESLMEKADLETVVISDNLWPQELSYSTYTNVAEKFASIEQVKGMLYLDVNGDYARYGREADAGRADRIYWFNDKPLVPCRYTLWDSSLYDGVSRTGLQLAQTINSLPTDPQNPDSYTFIVVHAWSYGLDEVATCIANLDPDVRVVTPDELIKQIRMNFLPCDDNPPATDITGNCVVDIEDLQVLAGQWLIPNPIKGDFNSNGIVNLDDFAQLCNEWLNP